MKKFGLMLVMCMMLLCGCEDKKNTQKLNSLVEKDVELTTGEKEQIWMIMNALDMEVESLEYNDLTNQDKIGIAFTLLSEKYKDIEMELIFSKSSLLDIFKQHFGENAEIKMEDYKCKFCKDAVLYKYNSKTEEFEYNNHGHGYSNPMVVNNIIGAKQKGDKLLVSVARLYAGPESDIYYEDPTQLYKNAKDLNNLENMVMNIQGTKYCKEDKDMGILTCDYLQVLNDYPENFSVYTYTFTKGKNLVFDNLKLN